MKNKVSQSPMQSLIKLPRHHTRRGQQVCYRALSSTELSIVIEELEMRALAALATHSCGAVKQHHMDHFADATRTADLASAFFPQYQPAVAELRHRRNTTQHTTQHNT